MSSLETEASSSATKSGKRRTPDPEYDCIVLELLAECSQGDVEAGASYVKQARREILADSGRGT